MDVSTCIIWEAVFFSEEWVQHLPREGFQFTTLFSFGSLDDFLVTTAGFLENRLAKVDLHLAGVIAGDNVPDIH